MERKEKKRNRFKGIIWGFLKDFEMKEINRIDHIVLNQKQAQIFTTKANSFCFKSSEQYGRSESLTKL